MQVQSLGWENPLKEEMATLSSILAWKIPWTEEPGMLQLEGDSHKESDSTKNTDTYTEYCIVQMCHSLFIHSVAERH